MRFPGAPEPSARDRELLERAARAGGGGDVELATARLYLRVVGSEPHAGFLRRVSERMASGAPAEVEGLVLGIVPGAFWREYPHTGADGRIAAEAARAIGLACERLPIDGRGRVEENARAIEAWLARPRDEEVLLASISKGSADVARTLGRAGDAPRPGAWIDLSGLPRGTPMVRWFEERPLRKLLLTSGLRLRGFDPAFLADLERPDEPPSFPADLPVVRVLGFPLERHCTHPLARRWWKRLAPLGPNDGAGLLEDALALPGRVVPIWGCDHYLQPGFDPVPLLAAVLAETIAEVRAAREVAAGAVA